jgi:hypothetical protein
MQTFFEQNGEVRWLIYDQALYAFWVLLRKISRDRATVGMANEVKWFCDVADLFKNRIYFVL